MSLSRRSRSKAVAPADSVQSSASTSRAQSRNVAKEARRIRGEIACAECRRLKIRCDRKVPCSTCVTRGCAVLCPNDVLPPGDNSRHVDFATDHLQLKITRMEARMHLLEDALQVAQMHQSERQHPLLRTPFKFEDDEVTDDGGNIAEPAEELAEAIGSLHINARDKSVQFYGPTGGAESLLREVNKRSVKSLVVQDGTTPVALRALGLPQDFDVFFLSFPFTPMGVPRESVRLTIEALLPPRERAEELCEIFMENLSWMFQIVTMSYLRTELVPVVYRRAVGDPRRAEDYCPHDLALMLIVLAIGALVDLTQRPYNAEAHRYAAMARTAAGMQPLMENISLASVKFTHLLSIYNGMCGKESAMSNTYALANAASIMAQKIGLHMDPAIWNLDDKTCYERRSYFWSLLQADVWMCLSSGRPPSLSNSGAHCKIPTEEEHKRFQKGEKKEGFGVWGFIHTRDCLLPLARHINSTTPPTYQSVLDLEKNLVAHFVPNSDILSATSSISTDMRAWVRSHYHALILLFLHRAFFAKAIATHPDNPLNSPYAHSFRMAYHCACVVVRTTKYQYAVYPDLMSRVWQIWTFAFTSAVIIGAVASRAHQSDFDPPPLQIFEESCQLFREASAISPRAAKGLPVLLSIQQKSHSLHGGKGKQLMHSPAAVTLSPGSSNMDEEVAIFGGKTRIVAQSLASPSPFPTSTSLPSSSHPSSQSRLHSYPASEPRCCTPSHYSAEYPQTAAGCYNTGTHPVQLFSSPASHDQPTASCNTSSEEQARWEASGHGHGQGLGLSPDGPSNPAIHQFQDEGAETVDFVLGDAWSGFLQSCGAIPPPNPQ